jgi:hypothetical protein
MPRLDSDDPAVVRGVQLLQGGYIRGWQETLPERFGRPPTMNDVADKVREVRKSVGSLQNPQPKKSDTHGEGPDLPGKDPWYSSPWEKAYLDGLTETEGTEKLQGQGKIEEVDSQIIHLTIYCLECQTGNSPDSKFCSQCGAELPPQTCAACGKENPPGDRYCNNCGKELE